jgi:cation diffusion facilitator family transporter
MAFMVESPRQMDPSRRDERARLLAVGLSLAVGSTLFGFKIWAHRLTGSTAVLSDALESIVNVVAACFAFGSVIFAGRPADRSHPYGHGKIEFFTAAFEGGLISFAAAFIVFEAARTLIHPTELRGLDQGLLIVSGAGLINAGLGLFLIRAGRRYHSITLTADGKHVLSDFWTSLGVVVGLVLVRWTGLAWLDSLVAAVVGINLAWTGGKLVRQAAGGLLDEEDPTLVRRLVDALDQASHSGIIRIHDLRAIRAGRFHHVNVHLVVPEHWSVSQAHEAGEAFAERAIRGFGLEGEILFHTDPCRMFYCRQCDLPECARRRESFVSRPALTVEEAVRPDLQLEAVIRQGAVGDPAAR